MLVSSLNPEDGGSIVKCLYLHFTLKMEAAWSSETLVSSIYPEDGGSMVL
jgi:hypothetical protein